MHPETGLYLGLVHYNDARGDAARLAAARRYAGVAGVATECGMARGDPALLPALLACPRRGNPRLAAFRPRGFCPRRAEGHHWSPAGTESSNPFLQRRVSGKAGPSRYPGRHILRFCSCAASAVDAFSVNRGSKPKHGPQ